MSYTSFISTTPFASSIDVGTSSDTFLLDGQIYYGKRVSRTVKGGRRSSYSTQSFSVGSNLWSTYVYFGKGKSEHRFKASEKAQGTISKNYGYQNYRVIRKSTSNFNNKAYRFSYKSSLLDMHFNNSQNALPSPNSLSVYKPVFVGLFPFNKIHARFRNTRSTLVQSGCLKKSLQSISLSLI